MRKAINIAFIFMLLIAGFFKANAQTAREFWFVAPDLSAGHGEQPLAMRVTTYNRAATVTLSLPADPNFTPLVAQVPANSIHSFNLTGFLHKIESNKVNQVDSNGILLTATENVAAYYEVGPHNNTDIFTLKGEIALGKEFLVSAQSSWSNFNYNPAPKAATSIVATENNTQVSITPSNTIQGHLAGQAFSINLNKGESYTIVATSPSASSRYGGTKISSNKPVAVTISDDSVINSNYGGCREFIGDQTIPVNQLGKEYVLVKGFLGIQTVNPDHVYILATEDSTSVSLNGGASTINLNEGQSHEYLLYNQNVHLLSDKPVYVMHITGFGCEIGMAIVPSIYCTGSSEVGFNRSQSGDFYMVIIVPLGAEDDFKVNGNSTYFRASDFQAVSGTNGNWLSARKKFSSALIKLNQSYRVTNNSDKFHMGIINGTQQGGCLYGYFTDFSHISTPPIYHH